MANVFQESKKTLDQCVFQSWLLSDVWNSIPMPVNVTNHKYNEEGKEELKVRQAWK